MVASGEFVSFVFRKAFLGEVFVVEGTLVGFFGVTGVEGRTAEHLANGFAGLRVLRERGIRHGLNDLKLRAGAAVRQNFFVGVGWHGKVN